MQLAFAELRAGTLAMLDGDVLFNSNTLELTAEGEQALASLTRTMRSFDGILSIRIIGHADDTADSALAQSLSEQRASWLKTHFSRIFPGSHILTLGAGDSIPHVSNETLYGRARNSRVQIQVIASGKVPGTG